MLYKSFFTLVTFGRNKISDYKGILYKVLLYTLLHIIFTVPVKMMTITEVQQVYCKQYCSILTVHYYTGTIIATIYVD